jgi:hypothetical protein
MISTQFDGYLRQNRLMQRGTEYHTVAVIGAQSSGKSKSIFLLPKSQLSYFF